VGVNSAGAFTIDAAIIMVCVSEVAESAAPVLLTTDKTDVMRDSRILARVSISALLSAELLDALVLDEAAVKAWTMGPTTCDAALRSPVCEAKDRRSNAVVAKLSTCAAVGATKVDTLTCTYT